MSDKSVLLVMDVQPGVVERLENKDDYLGKVRFAVDAAHNCKIPVIYVVVGFRPGFPEISARNRSFGRIKESSSAGMVNPLPVIDPSGSDIVVTKHRVSAFSGSDLEIILRSMEISHLVLCGIATSGVVLSTARDAADRDYKLTVISDLCADSDPEVHRLLLEKILARQADVITSDAWIKSILS